MNTKNIHGIDRYYAILVRKPDGSVRMANKIFWLSGFCDEKEKEERFRERLDRKGRNIAYCIMDVRF